MISQSWCCPWGRPQCGFCLAGTPAVIIHNIFIPSKETSTYNQAQTWFAVVISVWQVFCSLVVRTVGGAVIYAQRLRLGGHLNEWSFRLMPFPSPAECKDPNPRWSKLTHLHQLRSCCTGFLAERTWSVGHGGGRGEESKWSLDQVCGISWVAHKTQMHFHILWHCFKRAIPSAQLRSCWNQELCRIEV